jgi:protein-S-isoprenylcysteine O-methyltransferase Ste14
MIDWCDGMTFVCGGVLAFILFAVYDMNSIIFHKRVLKSFFFIGCAAFMVSIAGITWNSRTYFWRMSIISGFAALVFLGGLVYTLFFAIPFKKTYIKNAVVPKVCSTGIYAVCRHPGVLWLMGFCIFNWITLPSSLMLIFGLLFSALDVLYAYMQDRWTFPHLFINYEEYKYATPFLVPTRESIKRSLHISNTEIR